MNTILKYGQPSWISLLEMGRFCGASRESLPLLESSDQAAFKVNTREEKGMGHNSSWYSKEISCVKTNGIYPLIVPKLKKEYLSTVPIIRISKCKALESIKSTSIIQLRVPSIQTITEMAPISKRMRRLDFTKALQYTKI